MRKGEAVLLACIVVLFAILIIGAIKRESTKCVGGYLFSNGWSYSWHQQIIDDRGNGIPCDGGD